MRRPIAPARCLSVRAAPMGEGMLPAPGEFVVVRRRPLRALATAVLPVALAAVAAVLPAGTSLAADEHPAGNTDVGQLEHALQELACAEGGYG